MLFIDLPLGAKKAIIHYFIIECFNDDLGNDVFNLEDINNAEKNKISESTWDYLLEKANSAWSEREFSLSLLSSREACSFVEKFSKDVMLEWGGFDEFRKACGSAPKHLNNSWPVLAMPSCGEALLDGWNRFHSYLNKGFDEIYFINLDEISIKANENYLVKN